MAAAQTFKAITAALVEAFPEHPPYGGAHVDPVPHVTVATGLGRAELERIERELTSGLPLQTRVEEAWLVAHEPEGWRARERFPLGRLRASVESAT